MTKVPFPKGQSWETKPLVAFRFPKFPREGSVMRNRPLSIGGIRGMVS
jgi:hypothetical protein